MCTNPKSAPNMEMQDASTIRQFIPDNEISLNGKNDLLKTKVYADNLIKIINNTPSNEVFTIGVFGGWGTGKSSVIKTVKDEIESNNPKVKFVLYDAWKYANDSFRRMFLLKLQQELKMQQTPEMQRFYQSETAEQKPETVWSVKGIMIAVFVFIVIMALLWMTPISLDWKVGVTSMGTLLSLALALLNGCFYDLKLTINKPSLFAPEQFEECFKQMMSKCLTNYNYVIKKIINIEEYIKTGECSVKNLEKLVIVIDNIDRCPNEMAYQLLTDVKTFLTCDKCNIVFVIPVDDEALKKHLFHKRGNSDEDINREKEEFLRKFFNVAVRIKPHLETELQHFAHKLNETYNLQYNSETLALVAKEFADNPRRIIQLLNNLNTELNLYSDEFTRKCESAIAAVLILREAYCDVYKEAVKDPNVIKKYTDIISVESKDKRKGILEKSKAFMSVARIVFSQVSVDDLQLILTNTKSLYSDIPADIRLASQKFDTVTILKYIEENENNKNDVLEMTFGNLESDVVYQSSGQQANWLSMFAELNVKGLLNNQLLLRLNDVLNSSFSGIVRMTNNTDNLCCLANDMAKIGKVMLKKSILDYLINDDPSKKSNYNKFVKSVLVHFKNQSDCKAMHSIIQTFFDNNGLFDDIDYSDAQKEFLFDGEFLNAQISSLDYKYDGFRARNIIWCISNSIKIKNNTYRNLCNKIVELFGPTRGKKIDDYMHLINYSMQYLKVIRNDSVDNEMMPLYELVVNKRGIPHSSYKTLSNYDTQKSILDECNGDSAKTIAYFCMEIFRTSGGKINVAGSITILMHHCKAELFGRINELKKKNLNVTQFADIIMNSTDYENDDILDLTNYLLVIGLNDSALLPVERINSKICSLVDNANAPKVENLLLLIGNVDPLKKKITNEIVSRDSQFINALPVSLLKLAVSAFNKDSSQSYEDNFAYLACVAKEGNASQKDLVVNMMKKRLMDNSEYQSVLMVLENLETKSISMLNPLLAELRSAREKVAEDEIMKELFDSTINRFEQMIGQSGNNKISK